MAHYTWYLWKNCKCCGREPWENIMKFWKDYTAKDAITVREKLWRSSSPKQIPAGKTTSRCALLHRMYNRASRENHERLWIQKKEKDATTLEELTEDDLMECFQTCARKQTDIGQSSQKISDFLILPLFLWHRPFFDVGTEIKENGRSISTTLKHF